MSYPVGHFGTVADRFWRKVAATDGCWFWIGARNRQGYGKLGVAGRFVAAHRLSFEMFHGAIPAGMQLDHLCCNPRCVRPDHLEAVTNAENMRRRRERRTHCSHGHPLTKANLYVSPSGEHKCRTCIGINAARYRRAVN